MVPICEQYMNMCNTLVCKHTNMTTYKDKDTKSDS